MSAFFNIESCPKGLHIYISEAAYRSLQDEFVDNFPRRDELAASEPTVPLIAERRVTIWDALVGAAKARRGRRLTLPQAHLKAWGLDGLRWEVENVVWVIRDADPEEIPYNRVKALLRILKALDEWDAGYQWDHRTATYSFKYGWEGGIRIPVGQ